MDPLITSSKSISHGLTRFLGQVITSMIHKELWRSNQEPPSVGPLCKAHLRKDQRVPDLKRIIQISCCGRRGHQLRGLAERRGRWALLGKTMHVRQVLATTWFLAKRLWSRYMQKNRETSSGMFERINDNYFLLFSTFIQLIRIFYKFFQFVGVLGFWGFGVLCEEW